MEKLKGIIKLKADYSKEGLIMLKKSIEKWHYEKGVLLCNAEDEPKFIELK